MMEDRDAEIYRDERCTLGRKNGAPYLCADGETYALSCHPYDPCIFIRRGETLLAAIRGAFDPDAALQAFARGERIESVTGKAYTPKEFCELLAFAAKHLADTDIDYAEGMIAVEKLKAMGATGPESAVPVRTLGVRAISDRFSRSKKRNERVMYTEDGRAYLKIGKKAGE